MKSITCFLQVIIGLGVVPLAGGTEPPTFATEVAPLIYAHCATCHHPGGPGPFSLDNFDRIKDRSRQIAEVVASGFMPPWPPDEKETPPLLGARFLAPADREMLIHWHDAGAPSGDLSNAPAPPSFPTGWQLGEPDLILKHDSAFQLPETGTDIYRNFVISVPLPQGRYVEALEFRPLNTRAIHHAVILFDQSGWARAEDARDEAPGYGSMNLSRIANPAKRFIGWTPGGRPHHAYPGTDWLLSPAYDLVLQLHLTPTGKTESIQPEIGIHFSDTPPTRSSNFFLLSARTLDIPAGESAYWVKQSIPVPVDLTVLSVYPHAHYLAREMEIFATLPDGTRQWLLHIPDWDFNWQSDYHLAEPLRIPQGSTLNFSYRFDNSATNPRNPNTPPQRVQLGWNSTDEMAEAMIQVLLDKPADSHAVDMAQLNYEIEQAGGASTYYYEQGVDAYEAGFYEEAIAANEHALTYGAPAEPAWRLTGLSFIRLGDFEAAIAALENGIALDPANAELSRNLLPRALLAAGQTESARRILEQRLSDDPTHFDSVLTLSTLHQSQGDTAAAVRVLAATLNEHPEETYLHLQLGKILLATGKHEQARTHLRTAVQAGPPGAQSQVYASSNRIRSEAEFYLAHLCRLQGDPEAFLRHLENATELDPSHLEASQALQEAQSR